jgi:hypothetical protein
VFQSPKRGKIFLLRLASPRFVFSQKPDSIASRKTCFSFRLIDKEYSNQHNKIKDEYSNLVAKMNFAESEMKLAVKYGRGL